MKLARLMTFALALLIVGGFVFAQDDAGDAGSADSSADQAQPSNNEPPDGDSVRERVRRGVEERMRARAAEQAENDGQRPRRRFDGERFRDGVGREWSRAMEAANDPATVADALSFFEEHSPFRHSLYVAFDERATEEQRVAVARVRQKMVMEYVRMDLAAERYGERSRELAIARISAEDRIAESAFAYRSAKDDETRQAARDQLRTAVRDLMLTGLEEREHRLQRLRDRLEREMASVDQERSDLDERSEEQVQRLLEGELPPALNFDGPGRPQGPGGPDRPRRQRD